jgi:hypothetical protein
MRWTCEWMSADRRTEKKAAARRKGIVQAAP